MYLITRAMLLLVMAFVVSTSASGQQLRIGYVDMKQVLDSAPQVLAGRDVLDQEFRPRNDAIELEEGRVERLEQRLAQGDLEESARMTLEREIREARRSINRQREDLRDELSLFDYLFYHFWQQVRLPATKYYNPHDRGIMP